MALLAIILVFTNVWRFHDAFSQYTGSIPAAKVMLVASGLMLLMSKPDKFFPEVFGSKVGKYLGLYLIAAVISVPFSYLRGGAIERLIDLLIGSIPFVLITAAAARNDETLSRILKATVIGTIVAALIMAVGLGLVSNGADGPRTSLRGMYDPNDIGAVAAACAAFAIWLIKDKSRIWQLVGYAGLAASGYIVIRTYSRGAALATGTLVLAATFLTKDAVPRWVRSAIIPAVLLAFVFAPAKYRDRISTLGTVEADYNLTANTGRIEIWKRGLGYIASRPLTGVGLGQYDQAEGRWGSEQGISRGWKWSAAHNMYLEYTAETGLLGGVGLFGMLIATLAMCFKRMRATARTPADEERRRMAMAVFLATLTFCVAAIFVSAAQSPMLLFLVSLGIGLSLREYGAPVRRAAERIMRNRTGARIPKRLPVQPTRPLSPNWAQDVR